MNIKHWGRVAGMFGLVALFSGIFNWLFVSGSPTAAPVAIRLGIAVAGIGLWLFTTRGEKRIGKGAFYGTMSALSIAVVMAALVGANYIAVKKGRSWDLTKEKLFTLSDQTNKTMKDLKAKVSVQAFYSPSEPEYNELNARFDQYKRLSDKLTVEFVDPLKHPELVQQKNITQAGPRVLFTSGTKEARAKDIGEEALTNAVIEVTRGTTKKVYFVRGHGERSIKDPSERGFQLFADQLRTEGYLVDEIVLAEHKKMPDDTQVLVLAAPAAVLQDGELALVKDYVDNAGKLVVMLDPASDGGLGKMLAEIGIRVDNDIVVDPESQSPQMAIAQQYSNHTITTPREGSGATMSVYPIARSIAKLDEVPVGWDVMEIAKTGNKAWGENDTAALRTGKYEYNEGKDVKGPVAIVAVAQRGGDNVPQSRVAVFGNSLFAANTYLNILGNRDIALNAVAWAAKEESRISIRPKQRLSNHLFLTMEQKKRMTLFAFDLLPFGLLFAGLLVWQTRKSR
jgi:ABC-type uncharacterized transport system involved in gliding motility auxiliary subunit